MAIESAGILLYRRRSGLEVLLIHMGGPLWTKKDEAAWSIPKGVISPQEEPLAAARREFTEETGFVAQGPFESLGTFRQNASKNLSVWAAEGDCDPEALVSTCFSMVWPPRSGQVRQFPEADRGAWLLEGDAMHKIVKGQRQVLETFFASFTEYGGTRRAKGRPPPA
jgi:predicted NUDIX family NTP pyrophosphohydrolase